MYVRFTIDMIFLHVLVLSLLAVCSEAKPAAPSLSSEHYVSCLRWRVGLETRNIRPWATVPTECVDHVKAYMSDHQYNLDVGLVVENIISYAVHNVTRSSDTRLDVWVLDVDDTCLSNLPYYRKQKNYGAQRYDPVAFKSWALKAASPAIRDVLKLFKTLKRMGFKVILLSGRDDETFRQATTHNLRRQGFVGYHSLILRNRTLYKGQSAITYKSDKRKELVAKGYKIVGNVGDQWSDLLGNNAGNHIFKIPNPMYFIP